MKLYCASAFDIDDPFKVIIYVCDKPDADEIRLEMNLFNYKDEVHVKVDDMTGLLDQIRMKGEVLIGHVFNALYALDNPEEADFEVEV